LLGFFSRGFGHCSFSFLLLTVIHEFGAHARGFGPGYCFLRVIFLSQQIPRWGCLVRGPGLRFNFFAAWCGVQSPAVPAPRRLPSHVLFLLFAGSRADCSARLVLALIFIFLSYFLNCAAQATLVCAPRALCLAPGAITTVSFGTVLDFVVKLRFRLCVDSCR
jgi:hypothetical protein